MMPNKILLPTIRSESQLRTLLESLSLIENIQLLQTLLSNLGYYILFNNQQSELVIKFKPLYEKIRLVLNEGPLTKTKLTLNLISLMLTESSDSPCKRQASRMYAQNMFRISGCLSALCHLFTNSMLQHETWTALCHSLSEACYKSVLNQNYCTHLVPLCVDRCRRSNTDVLLVLHSLLVNHDRNIQVFYESDGMSIFSRDNLPHTSYLRALNTVIEGTRPSHTDYVKNAHNIFQRLRRWTLSNDSGSAVTQWAVIVLYSRRKLLGADSELIDEKMDCEDDNDWAQNVSAEEGAERIENPNSETQDLFRNVIKEVYDYKVQSQTQRTPRIPIRPKRSGTGTDMTHLFSRIPNNKPNSFLDLRKNKLRYQGSAFFQCGMKKATGDISFSFLLNESRYANRRKLGNTTCTVKNNEYLAPLDFREMSRLNHNSYRHSKHSGVATNSQKGTQMRRRTRENPSKDTKGKTTRTFNEYEHSTLIDFRPQHVSTPIRASYNRKEKATSNNSTIKDVTFKRHSPKCMKNMTMTSKFLDIINGSCTTIVKGISKIKNVFVGTSEAKDVVASKTRPVDCSYSFTNYMRERDAYSRFGEKSTNFSDAASCRTCNDTIVLKQKLTENPSLRECVKKLKLGINLYGCDFKKICRILWPREPYMTPEVLYSLYRKLIAK